MTRAKKRQPDLLAVETLQQTIDRVITPVIQSDTLDEDMEAIRAIREVVACELDKLANHYQAQARVIAANNIAYRLALRAQEIRSWKPTWRIVWRDPANGDDATTKVIEREDLGADVTDEVLAREAELMRADGLDARVELT